MSPAPLLVFGWGNRSRGDDALGPLFVDSLRAAYAGNARIECLDDYQLQPEHALDLVGRRQVLLVDASVSADAPFEVRTVEGARDLAYSSHALSPQALLQVYRDLFGTDAPPCTLLAIRGNRFELGEPPGAAALSHLRTALGWAHEWMVEELSD
jgi:hydrogenase maturation protease